LPAVRRVCLLLLLAAPLGACVAVQTDLATARPGSVVVERHQRYAEGARGELDVYRQAGDVSGRPILMFFHPGAFYIGNKGHLPNRVIATELAKRGAVVVVPNYSLFPMRAGPPSWRTAPPPPPGRSAMPSGWGRTRSRCSSPGIRPAPTSPRC
jgi:hypothetical protein